MEWSASIAAADAVFGLVLALLAGKAWSRSQDRRAAWMTAAMLFLAALGVGLAVQAWRAPVGPGFAWASIALGGALVSLYVGALR